MCVRTFDKEPIGDDVEGGKRPHEAAGTPGGEGAVVHCRGHTRGHTERTTRRVLRGVRSAVPGHGLALH